MSSRPSAFCALLLGLCVVGCGRDQTYRGPVRHVVFVSLDTTRADQLGCYGGPTAKTPNLDRLAAESIVLDDLMTVVPTTLSSHTSLFTGKYAHTHGVPGNGFVVPADNVTLPELLHDRGFTTAGFVASFALGSRFGLNQGFDVYDDALERFAGQHGVMQNERSAASVTDAVLGWLDQRGVPRNLFLFVHYFDAHVPYAAPPPYDTMYDPRGRTGLPDWAAVIQDCSRKPGVESEDERRMTLQYAGELSYLDEHLGRLLDALRQRGILDEALFVLTSDHGENFWEHEGCFDHGWNTYQATMRIAGIVRFPGGHLGGTRVGAPLSNIDVLPTALRYLGLTTPAGVEGETLDFEHAIGLPDRARFGQATKPWRDDLQTDPRWINMAKGRCVRKGQYKLVRTPWTATEELYDLGADPSEQHNLLIEQPLAHEAVVRDLRPLLETWAASARPLPAQFEMSQQEETIQRLKSLGYLGGHGE